MDIPAELLAEMDAAIAHYPVSKRSAVLPLLHLFQEHFGYITEEAVTWTANKLGLQPINVLEVVTFYPGFRQTAPGKYHVRVCRTLSCAMAGGEGVMERFCDLAKIDRSHVDHHHPIAVSPDQRFSIEFVECLASCGSAPVCLINEELHERVTPESVKSLVDQCA